MCGPKCNYDEKRLIDANALHKRIEMKNFSRHCKSDG